MSRDIGLTETGNLQISDGDLVFVDGKDEVAQSCRIRLKMWAGEWVLDVSSGTEWMDKVFPPSVSQEQRERHLKQRILGTKHMKQIIEWNPTHIGHTIDIEFTATSEFGDVVVEVRT